MNKEINNQKVSLTELKNKFISKKYISAIFRQKGLKISSANNNEVLQKVSDYLVEETKKYTDALCMTAEKHEKKIINLKIAEHCFDMKYDELQSLSLPSRVFSSKLILRLVHQNDKRISGLEPAVLMLKKLLYRKALHVSEKTNQACAVSKRKIVTGQIMDLALQMVETNN